MSGPAPSLSGLIVADDPECIALAGQLFPGGAATLLPVEDFAPPAPFEGPLFALVERLAQAAGALGRGAEPASGAPERGAGPASGAPDMGEAPPGRPLLGLVVPLVWFGRRPAPAAVLVTDHLNLAGRGPLAGRWPAARARAFPSMTNVYRPWAPPRVAPADAAAAAGAMDSGDSWFCGHNGRRELWPQNHERLATLTRTPASAAASASTAATGEAVGFAPGEPASDPAAPTGRASPAEAARRARAAEHQPAPVRRPGAPSIYSALAVAGVADAFRLTPFERRQMQRCGLVAASGQLVAPVVIAAYYGLAVAAAGAPRVPAEGSEGTS